MSANRREKAVVIVKNLDLEDLSLEEGLQKLQVYKLDKNEYDRIVFERDYERDSRPLMLVGYRKETDEEWKYRLTRAAEQRENDKIMELAQLKRLKEKYPEHK